jgi:hypothetical protein
MNAHSYNSNSDKTAGHLGTYQAPAIIEYGTLREVTLTVGNKGNLDGPAGGAKDRTST